MQGNEDDKSAIDQTMFSTTDPSTEYLQQIYNAEEELWKSLEEKSVPKLKAVFLKAVPIDVNSIRNGETCLVYASRMHTKKQAKRTYRIISILLENKADVHFETAGGWTSAHYCAMNGDLRSLILLFKNGASITAINNNRETPLHLLAQYAPHSMFETKEFLDWFGPVLEVHDVNAADINGYTLLHYASYRCLYSFVPHLLKYGADFSIPNSTGERPCTFIPAELFNEHFDDHITVTEEYDQQSAKMTFDFSCLLGERKAEKAPETEALHQLCLLKSHSRLLAHPLAKTFIYLKWNRCRYYYYVNMLFFLLYVLLLTVYLTIVFASPLPQSFGNVTEDFETHQEHHHESEDHHPFQRVHKFYDFHEASDYLAVILVLWNNLVALREFSQFMISPKRYTSKFENVIELLMVICVDIVLFGFNLKEMLRRGLAVVSIFFAWLELILILGKHRAFSISIEILILVTKNFLQVFFWYSNIILGFTVTFHIMFHPLGDFITFGETIMKMLTMMVGELNYTDIPFEEQPVVGRIIFVMFLLSVTVILMNLFTGLAVDDTRKIMKQAELIRLRSQLELIRYIEDIFFSPKTDTEKKGKSNHSLLDTVTSTLKTTRNTFCGFLKLLSPVSKCFDYVGTYILLFYACLPQEKATVQLPGRGRHIPNRHFAVGTEDGTVLHLDGSVVRQSKLLADKGKLDEESDEDDDDDDDVFVRAKETHEENEEEEPMSMHVLDTKLHQVESKLDLLFEELRQQKISDA